jgi:hypothetical protein
VVADYVIGVFQRVACENGNYVGVSSDVARGDEFPDARNRRSRGRFAANAISANHRLRVGKFLFADGNDLAPGTQNGAQRFFPRDGSTDFDGGGERLRIFHWLEPFGNVLNGSSLEIKISEQARKW